MTTLVLNLHPKPSESVRGKLLLDELKKCKNVVIRTAAEHIKPGEFTEQKIQTEQQEILKYKKIILLYPVYWGSLPGYSKMYIDEVMALGFAYVFARPAYAKLKGKQLTAACTTGSDRKEYTDAEVLSLTQIAKGFAEYTGMQWTEPLVLFEDDGPEKTGKVAELVAE